MGNVLEVAQGEGGEQGDPLMPVLFSLGQHCKNQWKVACRRGDHGVP